MKRIQISGQRRHQPQGIPHGSREVRLPQESLDRHEDIGQLRLPFSRHAARGQGGHPDGGEEDVYLDHGQDGLGGAEDQHQLIVIESFDLCWRKK